MECAFAIVEAKENPPKKLPKKKAPSKINRLRYFNVIFSDECREPLSMKGAKGIKTDEKLHKLIIKEYNNPDKHNEFAWPQLRRGVDGDPVFDPKTGPIVWTQSLEALDKVLKDYEDCVLNWELSKNHKAFRNYDPSQPSLPFSRFIQADTALLYVHEFDLLYPNVFEMAMGKLPPGVFSESIKGYERISSTPRSSKKQRVSHNNYDFLESYIILMQKKAKSSEEYFLRQSLLTTRLDIKTDKAEKRRLLVDAARARLMPIGDMAKRFKGYVAKKNKRANLDDDICQQILRATARATVCLKNVLTFPTTSHSMKTAS